MNTKLPALFISHGGGPWPWMPEMKDLYKITTDALRDLGTHFKPKAILMISAHWEESDFTISTAINPEMIYDYGGFPPHTYSIKYPAPGSPDVAERVQQVLSQSGITIQKNPNRGFDHGAFVPLFCMYPEADIPVVQLSIKRNYSPMDHMILGEALRPLREEGILITGSGLTYHNLRKFFNQTGAGPSRAFEQWLTMAMLAPPEKRKEELLNWEKAPFARDAHPREDHLVPLFVIAGAAGDDTGRRVFSDQVFGIEMASYQFGD
jgi:aromatic ring-opening dioxygenase catalytic subunit (LigB family)